ncbi:MAG TPA: hypothetical protein VJJ20_02980 [Candidatus Paceibacterota bacterium]
MKRTLFALILFVVTAAPAGAQDPSRLFDTMYRRDGGTYLKPTHAFFTRLEAGCREEQNITRHMNCLALVDQLGVLARKVVWDRFVYGQLMAHTRVLLIAFPKLRLLVFPSA